MIPPRRRCQPYLPIILCGQLQISASVVVSLEPKVRCPPSTLGDARSIEARVVECCQCCDCGKCHCRYRRYCSWLHASNLLYSNSSTPWSLAKGIDLCIFAPKQGQVPARRTLRPSINRNKNIRLPHKDSRHSSGHRYIHHAGVSCVARFGPATARAVQKTLPVNSRSPRS
jgi:hypothetical protein